MRTTVKTGPHTAVIAEPSPEPGRVVLSLKFGPHFSMCPMGMTLDEVGALIFGLERAAEAAQIAQERAALAA